MHIFNFERISSNARQALVACCLRGLVRGNRILGSWAVYLKD